MPIKVFKVNVDFFITFLCISFDSSINTSKFLQCVKLVEITPLHKKVKLSERKL